MLVSHCLVICPLFSSDQNTMFSWQIGTSTTPTLVDQRGIPRHRHPQQLWVPMSSVKFNQQTILPQHLNSGRHQLINTSIQDDINFPWQHAHSPGNLLLMLYNDIIGCKLFTSKPLRSKSWSQREGVNQTAVTFWPAVRVSWTQVTP